MPKTRTKFIALHEELATPDLQKIVYVLNELINIVDNLDAVISATASVKSAAKKAPAKAPVSEK